MTSQSPPSERFATHHPQTAFPSLRRNSKFMVPRKRLKRLPAVTAFGDDLHYRIALHPSAGANGGGLNHQARGECFPGARVEPLPDPSPPTPAPRHVAT